MRRNGHRLLGNCPDPKSRGAKKPASPPTPAAPLRTSAEISAEINDLQDQYTRTPPGPARRAIQGWLDDLTANVMLLKLLRRKRGSRASVPSAKPHRICRRSPAPRPAGAKAGVEGADIVEGNALRKATRDAEEVLAADTKNETVTSQVISGNDIGYDSKVFYTISDAGNGQVTATLQANGETITGRWLMFSGYCALDSRDHRAAHTT